MQQSLANGQPRLQGFFLGTTAWVSVEERVPIATKGFMSFRPRQIGEGPDGIAERQRFVQSHAAVFAQA